MKISNCYFIGGQSAFFGGAIYAYDSSILITKSVFKNNQAMSGGSIFYVPLSNGSNF